MLGQAKEAERMAFLKQREYQGTEKEQAEVIPTSILTQEADSHHC